MNGFCQKSVILIPAFLLFLSIGFPQPIGWADESDSNEGDKINVDKGIEIIDLTDDVSQSSLSPKEEKEARKKAKKQEKKARKQAREDRKKELSEAREAKKRAQAQKTDEGIEILEFTDDVSQSSLSPKEEKEARKKAKKQEKKARKQAREDHKKELNKAREKKKRARAQKKWARKQGALQKKHQTVQTLTDSVLKIAHSDQFVVKNLAANEAFYIPMASLNTNAGSTKKWTQRLTRHFDFEEGENIVMHFETIYYDPEHGLVYPSFAFQLNLEIPAYQFRSKIRLPAHKLKGYLSWVHPDFPQGDLFLPIRSGYLYIWRIKKGKLMGRVNMKFDHPDLEIPIHLYGKVRADELSRMAYNRQQRKVLSDLEGQIASLDQTPIHRDRLRPRRHYKSRSKEDRWIKGRSTGLWKSEK